jgi:hypothetical protein
VTSLLPRNVRPETILHLILIPFSPRPESVLLSGHRCSRIEAAPHPFFTGALKTSSIGTGTGAFLPSPPSLIHYLHLDPFSTLPPNTINTTNDPPDALPPSSSSSSSLPLAASPSKSQPKPESSPSPTRTPTPTPTKKVPVVFYDLDGTLIKTRSGADFPKSRDDWTWWDPVVPGRLKKEWEEGKHVVVISNQGDAREKIRKEWKAKVPLIAAKVGGASELGSGLEFLRWTRESCTPALRRLDHLAVFHSSA